jgi:hypothetical protein
MVERRDGGHACRRDARHRFQEHHRVSSAGNGENERRAASGLGAHGIDHARRRRRSASPRWA